MTSCGGWRQTMSLAVGCVIMVAMGSSYAIAAWNYQLKELLELDQGQITTINSSISFGLYLAIIPGIFYDLYGTKMTALVALLLLPLLYYSAHVQATPQGNGSVWMLAFTFGFIGLLTQFAGIVCIAANEGNFGMRHRGKVLGLLFSCFGSGGALFSIIYKRFFDHRVGEYFAFMAILSFLLCGFGVIFLHTKEKHTKSTESERLLVIESSIDITGVELLCDHRFWALFLPTMIGIGSGLFINANLAFIVESLHGPTSMVPVLISTFSLCNVGGRLAIGWASDAYVGAISRGHFLSLGLGLMAVAQLSFLWGSLNSIYVSVALAGIAEGCLFPSYSVITRELFGSAHFGKNFGYMTFANAIGFPILLGPLASYLYHSQATLDPVSGVEKCFGPSCFNPMFLICTALNAISLLGSTQLH